MATTTGPTQVTRREVIAVVSVLLVGLLVAMYTVHRLSSSPGSYWARTSVTLLAPSSTAHPNKLQTSNSGLIATAGIITRMVTRAPDETLPVDPSVTLVDRGVKDGAVVYQPNIGGQWAANFVTPSIIIDVVAPTPQGVQARTASYVRKIQAALDQLQTQARVDQFNLIGSRASSPEAQVQYSTGHRTRAAAVAEVLILSLTLWLAAVARRRAGTRRREVAPT